MGKVASKAAEKGAMALGKDDVKRDYRIAFMSRHASLLGRREVLSGKAKFGIFGDGKEVAQVALARSFRKGDWRSGYYRDQTFMFAIGASDVKKFFAQLYADTNTENEPSSGGRQMNSHFSTRYLDGKGQWLNQCMMYNSSADMSPTGGQMGRLLGLAYASKLYRNTKGLESFHQFSVGGNEVAFGTIGDASTSEGIFWEVLNAAGVLQVPMVVSVWDDGFGISVPKKYQTTKESISAVTAGFQRTPGMRDGYEIIKVAGWDYPALVAAYQKATAIARTEHVPCLVHVYDLTQPQGHSTSGSHERYKTDERMTFEKDMDCLQKMRSWIISENLSTPAELDNLEREALAEVNRLREAAWDDLMNPIIDERAKALSLYEALLSETEQTDAVGQALQQLKRAPNLARRTISSSIKRTLIQLREESSAAKQNLEAFLKSYEADNRKRYSSHLYLDGEKSTLHVEAIAAVYADKPEMLDGSQMIRRCFDHHLTINPKLFIIGEDVGHLGGVNTEFDGLQEKHGLLRVTDTGIREATILGQGIGAAMRGLRPIVDIQYLDYVLYCLQGMSDDLATLHYRSAGGQIAPVIVRTKGHRLEGIWHTGSPMGTILHAIRGMHVCVPRNMVQAAGMYNTLLLGDDPAFVVEVLNAYRLKEALPTNLTSFRIPLGVPEIVREGQDVTIVTYGACVRIAEDAAELLKAVGIDAEIVDVRTLMPFDTAGMIVASLRKTNAVLFLDEDVAGGASAFMMQQVLDKQAGWDALDAPPKTLSAQDHRGAYASDGDYYSKPNAEDVFNTVYAIMHERDPYTFF